MNLGRVRRAFPRGILYALGLAEKYFKQWTKPGSGTLVRGALNDLRRNRSALLAENALLRQQVIVLQRHTPRPSLTQRDCLVFVVLARLGQGWRDGLLIVKPDTFLKGTARAFGCCGAGNPSQ